VPLFFHPSRLNSASTLPRVILFRPLFFSKTRFVRPPAVRLSGLLWVNVTGSTRREGTSAGIAVFAPAPNHREQPHQQGCSFLRCACAAAAAAAVRVLSPPTAAHACLVCDTGLRRAQRRRHGRQGPPLGAAPPALLPLMNVNTGQCTLDDAVCCMWIRAQLGDTGEDARGSCHLPVPMALRPLYTRSAAPAHSPALHLPALGALHSAATDSAARAQMKEKPSPVITRQRGPTNAQGLAERISHPGLLRAMPDLLLRRT